MARPVHSNSVACPARSFSCSSCSTCCPKAFAARVTSASCIPIENACSRCSPWCCRSCRRTAQPSNRDHLSAAPAAAPQWPSPAPGYTARPRPMSWQHTQRRTRLCNRTRHHLSTWRSAPESQDWHAAAAHQTRGQISANRPASIPQHSTTPSPPPIASPQPMWRRDPPKAITLGATDATQGLVQQALRIAAARDLSLFVSSHHGAFPEFYRLSPPNLSLPRQLFGGHRWEITCASA